MAFAPWVHKIDGYDLAEKENTMAMTMHVDIVSIEEELFSGLAEFVVAPAEMGEVCIYPMHAPMLTHLKAGIIRLKIPFQTQELVIYVSSGILEVLRQGVTILPDIAIRETDIKDGKLEEKNRQAKDAVKNYVSAMEYARLEVELGRSLAQMKGIERLLKGKNRF
jgi:F-type H+-transporting ATPase subunit epsilon